MPKKRINFYVPLELDQEVRTMAETIGIGYGEICNLIMKSGLLSLKISRDPLWKNYFESQMPGSKNAKTN